MSKTMRNLKREIKVILMPDGSYFTKPWRALGWTVGVLAAYDILSKYLGGLLGGLIVAVPLALHMMRQAHTYTRQSTDLWPPAPDDVLYTIKIPPTFSDYMTTIEMAAEEYQDAAVDRESGIREFDRDPYTSIVLKEPKGNVVGFADYYCFTRSVFERYLSKNLSELELFGGASLNAPEARQADVIYISTIHHANPKPKTYQKSLEAGMLAWGMLTTIKRLQKFPAEGIDFYAMAFREGGQGERMLRRLGFELTEHVSEHGDCIWMKKHVMPANDR